MSLKETEFCGKNSVSLNVRYSCRRKKMNQLTISDYGTSLGKRSERVSVRYRGEERQKEEHALMDLDQIVIASRGVSLSSDLN